jgi:signal transduction histidine kinase
LNLAAPLFLHYCLTFPVELGTAPQRRWALAFAYLLAPVAAISGVSRTPLGVRLSISYAVVVITAALAALIYVYVRRATPDSRRRLRLAFLGTLLAVVPPNLFYLLPSLVGLPRLMPAWVAGLFLLVAPGSYVLAVVRDNLFGIDRLLNRTSVYALLSLGILLLYLGPFLLIYRFLPGDWLAQVFVAAALTLLVGLSLDWTRQRVQRFVDRIFYGGWYDYPGVVEKISDALARSIERAQLTDVLTQQVPTLMQLDGGHLWIDTPNALAHRTATPPQLRFPLIFQNQTRGVWLVGARRDGDDFSDADRRILTTIARQAETALSNVLLVETLRHQLDEIRASRETLAHAQRQLLRSREEERARLARDLHDGPIQDLVGLNMQLGLLLAPDLDLPGLRDLEGLKAMRAEVRELLTDLRQVCAELRPPMLDTMGLGAALRVLADDWSSQNGIAVNLDLAPDARLRTLPDEVAVNLYRLVQEALTNIARHAAARQVTIHLAWEDSHLALTIRDDGRGFVVPGAFHELAAQGHFGLVGMQERVALIGGELSLESAPGMGTTVRVAWQFERA